MNDEKPVKLAAKLPKEHNLNGIDTVHDTLRRHGTAIIIMQVTAPTREERLGGIITPKAEIEWVEGLPDPSRGELGDIGAQLLNLARAERMGTDEGALFGRGAVLEAIASRASEQAQPQD